MTELQFRHTIKAWCPPWLAKALGTAERVFYVAGAVADGLVEWAYQGVQARLPGHGTPTALPLIGDDRRIRRGPAEPDASFAARLKRWRPDWKMAGSPIALIGQLRGYFTPRAPVIRYVNRTNGADVGWIEVAADGTATYQIVNPANWSWDALGATEPFRFWIVIHSEPGVGLWDDDGVWDDPGDWGDGGTWGSTATTEEVETVRLIVKDWQSAGSKPVEVIVAWDPGDFVPGDASPPNPDGNWANYGKNVAGTEVPARNLNAAYWPVG